MLNRICLLLICGFAPLLYQGCAPGKLHQTRAYSVYNKKPPSGYGAYGYVLLPSGYTTTSGPRYERMLHIANAFLENFLLPHNFHSLKDRSGLMVTHWMLKNNQPVKEDAASLLAEYDYATALSMLTAIKMSGKQGPVLVAWRKPYTELNKSETKQALIFDLSKFSDEDIDRAFKLWREMLSEDVDDWNKSKNKLVKFKEEVRNLFQQYGQTIVDLITVFY